MVMAFAGNKADLEEKRKVTAEVCILFPIFIIVKIRMVVSFLFSVCLCSISILNSVDVVPGLCCSLEHTNLRGTFCLLLFI